MTPPFMTTLMEVSARAMSVMSRACKVAEVPHYSSHQLRHRWISLRMMAGWPPARGGLKGGPQQGLRYP